LVGLGSFTLFLSLNNNFDYLIIILGLFCILSMGQYHIWPNLAPKLTISQKMGGKIMIVK